jgi:hypothetical protein
MGVKYKQRGLDAQTKTGVDLADIFGADVPVLRLRHRRTPNRLDLGGQGFAGVRG